MKGLAVLLTLLLGALLFSSPTQARNPDDATGLANAATGGVQLQSPPPDPPKLDIDVKVNDKPQRPWYGSPMWLAIGGLGLVVVIMLVAMAARGSGGGGTTVVRG